MKWIGTLLIIALIIGFITAPTEEKFREFANSHADTSACKPTIRHYSYKIIFPLFSLNYMTECQRLQAIINPKTGTTAGSIAIPAGTPKRYLGLFGRFWKI